MQRFLFALATLGLVHGARANALNATPAPAEMAAPEHLPASPITALEVVPAQIELTGKYAYAQILVTARVADGSTADVTRLVSCQLPEGLATITPGGQVAPVADGHGELTIAAGGQQVKVPVLVQGQQTTPPPDFIRDVNPVMTKLGCNAGTCHGAKDGKVGFKLSLRGYDPLFDVRALKDDLAGRRLNVASPDDSLMLLKATAGVPHEGGQRTKLNEKYYDIMRSWIAHGAQLDPAAAKVTKIEVTPKDPVVQEIGARQQTRIVATFADGAVRDVTAEAFVETGNGDVAVAEGGGLFRTLRRGEAPLLARYEGNYAATTITVMGDRSGFEWQPPVTWNEIDRLVAAKWQRMKIAPGELCSDVEFLRRVYLDLTGLPPSATEVRAFMADVRPPQEKRYEVIDRLIGAPDYLEHWTNKWCDLLAVNSKYLAREGTETFRKWVHTELEANTPYDQFVRKLISASGTTRENPAANYWKILRAPEDLVENTTHLFLATRFNCNKCHDHPFERWTQDQYYQLGAFFTQVQRDRDPQSGAREIKGTAVEKSLPLWEIIHDTTSGEMIHLRTNKPAAPQFPFAVPGVTPVPEQSRRQQLAEWLTSPNNRYFALSYVNRLWGYLTGVGVIEPLDDIRAGNPPTNPELLDYLTREFIGHGFDVRHVVRLICQSRTYQLSLSTNRWNEDDRTNYSHALARRLPAEVLYDAVVRVTGSQVRLPGVPAGTRAQQLPDSAIDLPSGFLAVLGRPARESACECERSSDIRLGSVMSLLSGPAVADAVGDAKGDLAKLAQSEKDDRKLVEEIFLRVLNRPVTEAEVQRTLEAWSRIGPQNQELQHAWQIKEEEQKPVIASKEAERVTAIAAAKAELARYEVEAAPKVVEAEKAHQLVQQKAAQAVEEYEKQKRPAAQAAWEQALPVERTYTAWKPLDIRTAKGSGGVKLVKQKDRVIANPAPKKEAETDYSVVVQPKAAGITGFLIEALPDAAADAYGPGSSSGNFVLTEITCEWAPGAETQTTPARFKSAVADFSQKDFEVSKAIDNEKEAADNGWAVAPQFGRAHYAAFALETPIGSADGATITLKLMQQRPGFQMRRFRVWYTTDAHVALGLPEEVLKVVRLAPESRTAEQQTTLTDYFREIDPESTKRALDLAHAALPLPPESGLAERRAALARAEEPVVIDPKLAQLRSDVEQSKAQAGDQRLTGVQDLVWALVNNPAFLFNH